MWNESQGHSAKATGPNFAGHYYVIRWGCGSNCLMVAVVDGRTGKVYGPPLHASESELVASMDPMSEVQIEFRPDSSLMVLRNGCRWPRSECGVYYFSWSDNKWSLLKRVLVDLAKDPP